MTDIRAARRSLRRYNTCNETQRSEWLDNVRAILIADGMDADDASHEVLSRTWDGMDRPADAAASLIADWRRRSGSAA